MKITYRMYCKISTQTNTVLTAVLCKERIGSIGSKERIGSINECMDAPLCLLSELACWL